MEWRLMTVMTVVVMVMMAAFTDIKKIYDSVDRSEIWSNLLG
jgi:hypothetical protein